MQKLAPELDLLNLKPLLEPAFGRKNISNALLKIPGFEASKRILIIIMRENHDIVYSRILPRVAQLLL